MNPQPSEHIGVLFAIIFVCMVIYHTIKAIQDCKTISIDDNFIIGYIESDPINIHVDQFPTSRVIKAKTKKILVEKTSFESQQLYADCIDALVALGMKKKQAKEKAKYLFSTMKTQPKSIQEFLQLALKMPS